MATTKIKLLSIYTIFVCFNLNGQTADWAAQGGGGNDDYGKGVSTDTIGNVYLIADYSGNIIYHGVPLSGAYFGGGFIAKHDSSGNVIWVEKMTGVHCNGISTDRNGNCYITGYCGNSTFYGNSSSISVSSLGNGEAFIAKYNSSGTILWVKRYGDSLNADGGIAIKTDAEGNSYVVGSSSHHDYSLGYGVSNYFLLKHDSTGNLLWTQTTNWIGRPAPTSLDIDAAGNCYVTGNFIDSVAFGTTVLHVSSAYHTSIFIVKVDKNGILIWAQKDGTNSGETHGISLDSNGNFYITGAYQSPSTFGSTTLTNGIGGMFIAKYDTTGTNLWAKNSSAVAGIGCASDALGNCIVTGWMNDTNTFGEGANVITLVSAKANREIFVAMYDPNGNLTWAISPGGSAFQENQVMGMHIDKKNNFYITGGFSETTIFDSDTLYAPYATSGYFDIFLTKFKNHSISTSVAEQHDLANVLTH